jgi:hypothetical protein
VACEFYGDVGATPRQSQPSASAPHMHHLEVIVKTVRRSALGALLGAACLALVGLAGPIVVIEALAYGTHEHFAAGEPGDPKKPFKVVKVTMLEDGKKLLKRAYEPRV